MKINIKRERGDGVCKRRVRGGEVDFN